ncbi:basic proline-rich protein-like [Oryx dammah]|uniref:basic proline-rich protein-like n=1 Tax=Oryx dammah TaxID=59534 RepID=UPI001A9B7AB9|nr:basic proline-rich protein-like [Oryx dammah]
MRPAVRSLRSSPPTPAPEVPGRPPPPGPDPLRAPAHRHQLRTHPQRRRADPALRSPDAEPGRPSDPRQRRARPTREARVHSGPGVHLGTAGLVLHPCPRPHAGRRCSCQAGTPSPGRPQPPRLLPGRRGWSQGGELGKLVNRRARPPVPPRPPAAPCRRPQPAPRCRRQRPGGRRGGCAPHLPKKPERRARPNLKTPAPQAPGARLRGRAGFRLSLPGCVPTHPAPAAPAPAEMHLLPRAARDPRLLPARLAEPRVRDHSGPRRATRARPGPQTWPAAERIYLQLPSCHLSFPCELAGFPLALGQGRGGGTGCGWERQAGRIV